jgi:hypothetical protein
MIPPRPFLNSFLLPSWRAVRTYRPHLEERDPIWGDDWSHSPFIRRSASWGFLGFFSAVRQMPGDLYTAPIITLTISDRRDWLGTSGLWLGTRTGDGGTATLTQFFFWPQPMAPWTTRRGEDPGGESLWTRYWRPWIHKPRSIHVIYFRC